MARIESPVGTSFVHAFDGEAEVHVSHNLGHRLVVQVLVKPSGGLYGFGGFGDNGYGTTDLFVPLEDANYTLVHDDEESFRVLMNNYYTGEIVYI